MSDIESIVGENVEIAQDAQETQETPAVQEVSETPEKEEHHEQRLFRLLLSMKNAAVGRNSANACERLKRPAQKWSAGSKPALLLCNRRWFRLLRLRASMKTLQGTSRPSWML